MANKLWLGDDVGNLGDYSVAANWSPSGVPGAGDDVRIPSSSTQPISSGLDQSAVAIGDFIVEKGYTQLIGSSAAYLQIDPNRFEFNSTGESWIDVGSANIILQVFGTGTASTGGRSLYLKGSNIATLSVSSGSVGLAVILGETSTVATVRAVGSGADIWLGEGVTLTTAQSLAGKTAVRCAATTLTVHGGTVTTEEEGAITTIDVDGGTLYPNSTDTVTTMTLDDGTTDFTTNGAARIVTTLKQNTGSRLRYDPAVLTITNWSAPDDPVSFSASRA